MPLDSATAAAQSEAFERQEVSRRRAGAGAAPAPAAGPAPESSAAASPAREGLAQDAPVSGAPAEAPEANPGEEPAPPPLSSLNKDEINKLLENRLDIGAYRVQIAERNDFSDDKILFDKTYDVMQDINLFDEFRAEGVRIDRNAYWVRIAFIDLLQQELPWTKARMYGLNKQRLDAP